MILTIKWLLAIAMMTALWWMSRESLAKLQNRQFAWQAFGVALGVRFLALLISFTRWRLLVQGIGLPFSMVENFRLGMLGEAVNVMGPGAVGGDLIKAALLAKDHPTRRASASATVFLDRVLGMWALFILGAIASLIPVRAHVGTDMYWAIMVLWCGAFAGLVGIGLMLVPAFTHSSLMHWLSSWKFVGHIVKELMESVQLYQGKPFVLVVAAGLGIVGHVLFLTSFYYCAKAIHGGQTTPDYIDHLVGLPLPITVSAVVPTPGGIGVLEGTVAWFYEQHQKSVAPDSTEEQIATAFSNGVLTALVNRLTVVIIAAIGVAYYLTSRAQIRSVAQATETQNAF